jgi:multicomponent Na+:H+ antiporter subunit E
MNFALVSVVLALIWVLITANSSELNILLGWLIGLAALWFIRERLVTPQFFRKLRQSIALLALFFYELFLSAIRVAILVIMPNMKAHLKPGIVAFPLSVKSDNEITLLANLITLTPGTLSVDVSRNREILYIHALSVENKSELITSIAKGFEKKIIEVFS